MLGLLLASTVCTGLQADFEKNERAFAVTHGLQNIVIETEETAYQQTEAADHALAMAQARAYGYVRREPTDRSKVEQAEQRQEDSDKEYKEQGDRITTLLIANKCKAPDHVTSPETYKAMVDELKAKADKISHPG